MNNWKLTEVFWDNIEAANKYRIIGHKGGTSSSKTYSNIQTLYTLADQCRKPLKISVVSESFPHLRRGAMQDFFDLIDPVYDKGRHDKTNHVYRAGKSKIEFFSADQMGKVKGPRRDILYINECNHIPWKIVEQMIVRTKWLIFLDWNPESEFWFEEKLEARDDVKLIHSTYKKALNVIPASIVKEIELREPKYNKAGQLISGDPYWWEVYALGKTGSLEGLVYKHWETVNEMPTDDEGMPLYKWIANGLDFGFTNDPTAMVEVAFHDGCMWVNELIYEKGLTNPDISERMEALEIPKRRQTFADSAEPKSIREIQKMGWHIRGAQKGKDSIHSGIQVVQQYPLKVTKNSLNLIKELRNYKWLEKNGDYMKKPVDKWNHALDALRYCITMKKGGMGGGLLARGS